MIFYHVHRNILCILQIMLYIQTDLNTIDDWSSSNYLEFNTIFQKIMILSCKKKVSSPLTFLSLGVFSFDWVYSFKYLWVILTCDLTLSNHTQMVCNKARKILGVLHKRFYNAPASTWFQLYLSMVRPHLEYASPVWSPHWLRVRNWLRVCRGLCWELQARTGQSWPIMICWINLIFLLWKYTDVRLAYNNLI